MHVAVQLRQREKLEPPRPRATTYEMQSATAVSKDEEASPPRPFDLFAAQGGPAWVCLIVSVRAPSVFGERTPQ